ncbi:MAG: precorrin-6A reductase [Butyrivibrio sp.]|nr:precorrin-6A reductase [Butyrivibrio sp.]
MKKVIIFGGTTEGRELAVELSKEEISSIYLVATDYGKMVVPESDFIDVRIGRLDNRQMSELFEKEEPMAVVDATHPYAQLVKKEIKRAINRDENIPFFRLLRAMEPIDYEDCTVFESAKACADALKEEIGNIFLTTGSKELPEFCKDENLRQRITARVIPNEESLKICYDNGLKGEQIVAMQGPFSREMNLAFFRNSKAKYVVLKESGRAGGEKERIMAAKAAGAKCFIIKRPLEETKGQSLLEIKMELFKLFEKNLSLEEQTPDEEYVKGLDITLAGIGMGFDSVTKEVRLAIDSADYIFGAERMLEIAGGNAVKYPYYLAKDIIPVLKRININGFESRKTKVVILFSGDTGFFSGAAKLKGALNAEGLSVRILPGISSVSALCGKLSESWQDAVIISTHGINRDKWEQRLITSAATESKTICITSGVEDVKIIGDLLFKLMEKGKGEFIVFAGLNLYDREKIMELTPAECMNLTEEGLYTVLIKNSRVKEKRLTPGMRDEEFIRDKVPMTKEEIRALSICKLGLCKGAVVYDIGGGTGSVSVEIGLLSPDITVYSIEKKPEACNLIQKNIDKFDLKNVKVVEGIAPQAIEGLKPPTHVFIGGSTGELENIILTLRSFENPIRVVVNAVTIETLSQVNEIIKKYSLLNSDIIQVQISKTRKAGNYSLMEGLNPVYIVSFDL